MSIEPRDSVTFQAHEALGDTQLYTIAPNNSSQKELIWTQ